MKPAPIKTNETGTYQIVVKAFPDPNGNPTTVTAKGGIFPTWRGDGRELYYLAPGGKLMAVEVKPGATFNPGAPKLLFDTWVRGYLTEFDVSRDGQKFLMLAPAENFLPTPATVLMNWPAALKH